MAPLMCEFGMTYCRAATIRLSSQVNTPNAAEAVTGLVKAALKRENPRSNFSGLNDARNGWLSIPPRVAPE